MGEEDPRPALEDAGMIPGPTEAAGPIIGALAQLPQSLAVGMNFATAVGGLGLVVLGVAVGLYFAQRRREFEFASLRAMGTEPKQVTRVLLLEQGLMITFAIARRRGDRVRDPAAADAVRRPEHRVGVPAADPRVRLARARDLAEPRSSPRPRSGCWRRSERCCAPP